MRWTGIIADYRQVASIRMQTIYIALDAGDAVIADAVINHADLLITHHPLLL